jgi:hypothetical protein
MLSKSRSLGRTQGTAPLEARSSRRKRGRKLIAGDIEKRIGAVRVDCG